jgi:hypothetical protein
MKEENTNDNAGSEPKKQEEHIPKQEIIITHKKNKKGLMTILIIVAVLLAIVITAAIVIFREWKAYGDKYDERDIVVAEATMLITDKPKKNSDGEYTFNVIGEANFGDIFTINTNGDVFGDYSYNLIVSSESGLFAGKKYYLQSLPKTEYISSYSAEGFVKMFPLKISRALPGAVKVAIAQYLWNNNRAEYHCTQDVNRSQASIVYSDLNMDNEPDYAVLLEDSYRSSMLLIVCYNKDIEQAYIAFSDYWGGVGKINKFNKNASIFIDSETLLKAPNAGIMWQLIRENDDENTKYAVFYNPKTMQFIQCEQRPKSEITYGEYIEDDDYDGIDEVEVVTEPIYD